MIHMFRPPLGTSTLYFQMPRYIRKSLTASLLASAWLIFASSCGRRPRNGEQPKLATQPSLTISHDYALESVFPNAKLTTNNGHFGAVWADGRFAEVVAGSTSGKHAIEFGKLSCATIPYASEDGFLCRDRTHAEFRSSLLGTTPLSQTLIPDASIKIAISSDGGFAAYSSGRLQYIVDGLVKTMDLKFPIIPTRKEDRLSIFEEGDPFQPSRGQTEARLSKPEHLAMVKGTLFFGFDAGEFGGWVATYHLTSGRWRVSDTRYPVKELHETSEGGVWVVTSSGHGGPPSGRVLMYKESKLTLLIDTET